MKPLFGFRALMADLADWIREHRMTLGFVHHAVQCRHADRMRHQTYAISAAIVAREF